MHNILKCFTTNYARFSGRMARKDYWLFILFYVVVAFVLQQIDLALNLPTLIQFDMQGSAHAGGAAISGMDQGGLGVLSSVFVILAFLPAFSAMVRRLHDTNRSGWWILLGFIPFFGFIVLLIMCMLQGTQGQNNHGAAV